MTTINDTIKELSLEGKSTRIIRATLTVAGYSDKDITEALKLSGIGRTTAGFTEKDTINFIGEGVTEFALYEKLLLEGNKNELRWIGARDRVRNVINTVYKNLGSPVEEKAATEEQKAEAKRIVTG